jgi:hypothetical protein
MFIYKIAALSLNDTKRRHPKTRGFVIFFYVEMLRAKFKLGGFHHHGTMEELLIIQEGYLHG